MTRMKHRLCWRTNMNIMCWSLLWAFLANKNDLTLHPRLSQSQFMSCRTGSRCWPSYLVRWVMKCYPDLEPSMNSPASGAQSPFSIGGMLTIPNCCCWWQLVHPEIPILGLLIARHPRPRLWIGDFCCHRGWEVACQHIDSTISSFISSPHMFHCM